MQFSEFPSSKPIIQIPNWALILLFAAYAIPGNVGHVPWRGDDVLHISVAFSMLKEGSWLTPALAGTPYLDWGPLTYWLGAGTGALLSWAIPVHDSIRLSMALSLAAMVLSLRSTAKLLYGKEVASAAVLLTLGSLGLLTHSHEMQPQITLLACMSTCLYGLASTSQNKFRGAIVAGLASAAATLTAGMIGLSLTLPLMLIALHNNSLNKRNGYITIAITFFSFSFPVLCWLGLLALLHPEYLAGWIAFQTTKLWPHINHLQNISGLANLLGWFTWPLWPVAIWSLWHRRGRYATFGHIIPLASILIALWLVCTTGPLRPANALPVLPPLILIAAAELCRLRRGATNAFDWFGIVTFSLLCGFLWLAWSGLNMEWPRGLAKNINRALPGYKATWTWPELIIAMSLTLSWIVGVIRMPFFQLRGALHWALGVTLTWGLATTLWLSWIDYDKSYQSVSKQIADTVKELVEHQGCIAGLNTGDSQIAGLYYFESIKLQTTHSEETSCGLLLSYSSGRREQAPISSKWKRLWETQKGSGRIQEKFALYIRETAHTAE